MENGDVTHIGRSNFRNRIELWDHDGRSPQRVLARALNAPLARALFKAAQKEHPDRRILLRRGARIIADSTG
jgi:hypothetical protein